MKPHSIFVSLKIKFKTNDRRLPPVVVVAVRDAARERMKIVGRLPVTAHVGSDLGVCKKGCSALRYIK